MKHLGRGAVYIAASVHGVPVNRLRDSSEFFFRQGDVARVNVAENARGAPVFIPERYAVYQEQSRTYEEPGRGTRCGPSEATHAMQSSAADIPFFSAIAFSASTNTMFRFMFCDQY
jgi:hypothetical protein